MTEWTLQRVEQLAPDSSSLKSAQGLAKPDKWRNLGCATHLLWGECQGSGANPYQVRIETNEVAYKCSCPSRKLPCKHALGLLLLFAQGKVPSATPLPFIQEWIDSRIQRAASKVKASEKSAESVPVDVNAQKKRVEKRGSRVESGLQLLSTALADLVMQGLATARNYPDSYWSQLAARLIDAQAPGLARRVKALGNLFVSRTDWQDATLEEMASLQLLIDAYRNLANLPVDLAAEVRTLIGWVQDQSELLERDGVEDLWLVAGREQLVEDALTTQRTWLLGKNTGRWALLLDFAVGKQPLPANFAVGQCVEAALVFFDSASPLRALVKERRATHSFYNEALHANDVATMQSGYAAALSKNPWLDRWPVTLGPVTPALDVQRSLHFVDASGKSLRLQSESKHSLHLLSISGGTPLIVHGLWNGSALQPLSVIANNCLYSVGAINQIPILAKVA